MWEGGGAPCDVMVFQRYALTEPLVPAAHQNMHGWPGILKGVVLRAMGDLMRLELDESDTDEESERSRAESDTENESE